MSAMSFTATDLANMEQMLRGMVAAQDIDVNRTAALSELCDRLLREDPGASTYVRGLARIAEEGLDQARGGRGDDIAWTVMVRLLSEAADTVDERVLRYGH
jgi:hypothetical protein